MSNRAAAVVWLLCVSAATAADPVVGLAEDVRDRLGRIADLYLSSGRPLDAARLRALAVPVEPAAMPLNWPAGHRLPEVSAVDPPVRAVYAAEREAAADLAMRAYRLSRGALSDKRAADAFRLTHWALAIDPECLAARKALGFEAGPGGWASPFEHTMRKSGKAWDARFGWRTPEQVARYESGQRYVNGRWVDVDTEAALRTHFRNAWSVETEHFRVRTNDSLETAVDLASRLEDFRTFFIRNYTELFDSPRRAKALFVGSAPVRKHQVKVFATQEEYVRELAPKQRGVEVSRGVYLPGDRVSYFYVTPDDELRQTLFHEVSHQLLFEADSRVRDVGADSGYWAVEGFACYLESFESDGVTGTAEHPMQNRVVHAATLARTGEPVASLEWLDSLGKRAFLRTPDIETLRKRYATATALTHFFLHANAGRYRSGFLTYLRNLYGSDRRSPSLAECVGVPAAMLDAEYRDFVTALPEAVLVPAGGAVE